MRVLHITDLHLKGRSDWRLAGVDPSASYDAVLRRIAPAMDGVDLVLATGDISHNGDRDAYRRFRRDFEAFGRPALVMPGNHDELSLMRDELGGGDLLRLERDATFDGWRFLSLNSQVPGAVGGRLGEEQLRWLEGALGEQHGLPTLVALHHQPVPVGARWLDEQRVADGGDLLELLQRHPQVRLLVWGHVHQEFDRRRDGLRLLATPSTCIQFKPGCTDFALDTVNPGVRWLDLGEDGSVETWVERIDGDWAPDPSTTGYE